MQWVTLYFFTIPNGHEYNKTCQRIIEEHTSGNTQAKGSYYEYSTFQNLLNALVGQNVQRPTAAVVTCKTFDVSSVFNLQLQYHLGTLIKVKDTDRYGPLKMYICLTLKHLPTVKYKALKIRYTASSDKNLFDYVDIKWNLLFKTR